MKNITRITEKIDCRACFLIGATKAIALTVLMKAAAWAFTLPAEISVYFIFAGLGIIVLVLMECVVESLRLMRETTMPKQLDRTVREQAGNEELLPPVGTERLEYIADRRGDSDDEAREREMMERIADLKVKDVLRNISLITPLVNLKSESFQPLTQAQFGKLAHFLLEKTVSLYGEETNDLTMRELKGFIHETPSRKRALTQEFVDAYNWNNAVTFANSLLNALEYFGVEWSDTLYFGDETGKSEDRRLERFS